MQQRHKKPKTLTQSAVGFVHSLFPSISSKDPARAENIRNIVPYLDPDNHNPISLPHTRVQKALMLVAHTVLASTPKKLADLVPEHLIGLKALLLAAQPLLEPTTPKLADLATKHLVEVRRDEEGFSAFFGPKSVFEFTAGHDLWFSLGFNNCSNQALAAHFIQSVGALVPDNIKGLNALLTAPPKNSITRVPLHLVCIWKFNPSTPLATMPRDLLKIMIGYVRANIKDSLLKQIEEAVAT